MVKIGHFLAYMVYINENVINCNEIFLGFEAQFFARFGDFISKTYLHFLASPLGLRTGDFGDPDISVGVDVGFGDSLMYLPGTPAAVPLLMVKVVMGIAMGSPPRLLAGEIMVA